MTYHRHLRAVEEPTDDTAEHKFKVPAGNPDGGNGLFAALYVVGLGLVVGAVLWIALGL